MNYRNPLILTIIVGALIFSGCDKWRFNHRVKGTYTGSWESYRQYNGIPYHKDLPETINVAFDDEKDKTFTITSQYISNSVVKFEYDRKKEEYEYDYQHREYQFKSKAVFRPKDDSLIIYTDSRTDGNPDSYRVDTFRGKKG